MEESYSIRRIQKLSGHSKSKLERIKNYWLNQIPKEKWDYQNFKYLLLDGTYFHQEGCFFLIMDAMTQDIIFNAYIEKEGYYSVIQFFKSLKEQKLDPHAFTTDGHRAILRALKEIWPQANFQRCLYHIQREGLRWLRTYPKTDAGKQLRIILKQLHLIRSHAQKLAFFKRYQTWSKTYKNWIETLPKQSVACKDLKKTRTLIDRSIPDLFHYLNDKNIHSTTNLLESFFSRLKADFRRHRGLSKAHKIAYLKWYCFFKNRAK